VLFGLFAVQFVASIALPEDIDRIVVLALSGLYGLLAVAHLVRRRRDLLRTLKDGLVTPYSRLEEEDREAERVATSPRSGSGDSVGPS
jgi:cation:H+ antiporter